MKVEFARNPSLELAGNLLSTVQENAVWGCLPGGTSLCNNPAWEALLGVAAGLSVASECCRSWCWRSFLPCRTPEEAGSKHSCVSLIAFTHQASCPSSWQSKDIVDGPEPLSQSGPKGCIESRGPGIIYCQRNTFPQIQMKHVR